MICQSILICSLLLVVRLIIELHMIRNLLRKIIIVSY
nr:MAG TPA: hypothetical protein [Caudoviricetes sp.]